MTPTSRALAAETQSVDEPPVQLRIVHVPGRTGEDAWLAALAALGDVGVTRVLYASIVKRVLDLTLSLVLLFVLSPLLLGLLLLVIVDSRGPAIFRQARVGRGGRVFRMYKFRTMVADESAHLRWVMDGNGMLRHKVRNDPRVTRAGRWLRRTSFDELPQLVNVLRGEMSLIGPRPELPEIVRGYRPWQHERHLVRPGLTGWWQVSGRSDLPMHENTELDIFYVRRLSFGLDRQIAWRTVRVVLKGFGAF